MYRNLAILAGAFIVGVAVATLYYVFETALHESINVLWYEWFNTGTVRGLVFPLAITLSFIYFGLADLSGSKSFSSEVGLGHMPKPSLQNLVLVLLVGYFSLLAGAVLGPEAILVPASMIVGALAGRLYSNHTASEALIAAAIIALFAAFFKSVIVGFISVLLVTQQTKSRINLKLILIAIIASASSYLTLRLLSGRAYVQFPKISYAVNGKTLLFCLTLVFAGYILIRLMKLCLSLLLKVFETFKLHAWWARAVMGSLVITLLYLLGGNLVEFTGNLSIIPLFNQAKTLGYVGILWIVFIKTLLISWSKAAGYIGGMIFPTIFLASALVALVVLMYPGFNLLYGLLAVLVGAFTANRKTRVLV